MIYKALQLAWFVILPQSERAFVISRRAGRRSLGPPCRKHLLHPGLGEAFIYQHQHAPVLVSTDNPASRLDHFAHTRVKIGVVKTRTKLPTQALLELLVDRVDLRQPQGGDKRPDQPRTW